MDDGLDASERALQDAAIRFARTSLGSENGAMDDADFDRVGWKHLADHGLFRMPVPVVHGGLGLRPRELILVLEALGYATRRTALLFAAGAHLWATMPLVVKGSEAQRVRFLARLASGEAIGANAASEPEAGSDVFSLRTRALKRGDGYVLNGTKTFVSNGPVADVFIVYATIDPAYGAAGITAFVLERGTPGMTVGRPLAKMGLHGAPMSELVFEDCVVSAADRLGREGRGAEVFDASMEWERGCVMASSLGTMRSLLERCITHAQTHRDAGQPLGRSQSVAKLIVGMRVRLDAARALVYRVGTLKNQGVPCGVEASIAKLFTSESYVQSCLDAIEVFGSEGYATECGIERELRDAVGSRLYAGTSEIQQNLIARGLGL